MKQAQRKDFFMEIKRSLNRYLSILFIVALGVAFFSGIRAAEPDMRLSVDAVADEANFMDIRILSAMGLTEGDLESIRQVPGITAAEGERSVDVLSLCGKKELVLHVSSMTRNINQVTVKEGRLPEASGECFLDENLLSFGDYQLGDEITVYSGSGDPLSDTLKTDTYRIVGIGTSPYYLNFDRGSSTIGNGDVGGFLMVPEEDFSLEVYTQIYAAADELDGFVTGSAAYQAEAERIVEAIEDIAGDRCEVRLAEIREEAEAELSEAEAEFKEREEEAEEELKNAWEKIEDGKKELEEAGEEIAEGERKLLEGRDELEANEEKLTSAKKLLAEKEEELNAAEAQLAASRKEYESGKAQTEAGRTELEEAKAELQGQGENLTAGWKEYESGLLEIEEARKELDGQAQQLEALGQSLEEAGLNPEENEQYVQGMLLLKAGQEQIDANAAYLEGVKAELTAGQAQYDQAAALLSAKEADLLQAEAAVSEAGEKLAAGEQQTAQGRAALKELKESLESGEKELSEGWKTLSDSEAELAKAKEKMADGEKELSEAMTEYEDARGEADEKLSEARRELEDARQEIDDLEEPEWYVLDRKSVSSYVEYDNDADRIGAIGKVLPVIFFLVAALVSLTTMTRMVEEKRTEIGTMKALGYSTLSIASKYILYALSASLMGSVLGFLVGEKLLPWVIITAYKILYVNLHIIRIPYNWGYALGATAIAVMCTTGATLAACYKEAMAQPSQLMRPVAPLQGKKILIERIRPVWKHLNFSQKSTLRNLFRYKKRLLMTVFGIGACMALLIVGFGLRDSIYAVSDRQYGELWRYDVIVGLDENCSEEELSDFQNSIENYENVETSLGAYTAAMDAEAGGVTKTINLVVPENLENFPDFFVLRNRLTGEIYALDDEGAVISEKLAKQLGLSEGDSFYLKENDTSRVQVRVSHITENYVYNYVYLSSVYYNEIFGENAESNTEYVRLRENGSEREEELSEYLLKYKAVSGVTLVSSMNQSILDMLGSLDIVVWVLIISAGLLAFVVLYNLNNINITERKRELATIKLLGFYDMELAAYVYRENVLLTLIGIAAGIIMGNILHRFVIETVEVDLIMFGRTVHLMSYLWGIALTLLFALVVNVTMFYKLRRIDMVESLKSVE